MTEIDAHFYSHITFKRKVFFSWEKNTQESRVVRGARKHLNEEAAVGLGKQMAYLNFLRGQNKHNTHQEISMKSTTSKLFIVMK